ncbi:hypothetical protein J0A67_17425 [Algoriphagus aestuariicola]|uniref:Uncharacterized protein n=1 Tax=Algoriphagus aestuariicola TaxID=1852016 RepID=A0ABS3BTU3_9BACT|nr:hypothetical protein [Algoriphagus aestuariicola]MBN7802661.1 hypothetical protein [Algoriphagus aestuariicola]
MTVQINSNYLENYSSEYARLVCDRFFSSRQFITGQDIIQLTSSTQVNFFIIKRLFELWQEELGKLKSNPYFDYRDIAVHEALTQFMNVLSRRIKVERSNLEPLVKVAVKHAVEVATDPVAFYQSEINKAPQGKINEYLKENKKYYKWHDKAVVFLIDKTGFGHDKDSYLRAVAANYQVVKDSFESVNLLLATLGDVKAFDLDQYLNEETDRPTVPIQENNTAATDSSFFEEVEASQPPQSTPPPTMDGPAPKASVESVAPPKASFGNGVKLDASKLKSHFASESYRGMVGILGELSESLALNQRFMFTKELFDGNADLLRHALKSIDEAGSFDSAVELINTRYVSELSWEPNSDVVREFMQLVYRKYSD